MSGIYWDEDFAVRSARWTAEDGESERLVVTEVAFRRDEGETIYVVKPVCQEDPPEGATLPESASTL